MYSFAIIVLVLHLSYCFAYPITIQTFGDGYDTDLFDADDADAWNAVDNGRNGTVLM
ncbi:unnamed protein product [Anisakis simplex]|uniref:Secreted protein n=1 Tax=Anisakis simplex TaxID=6269 RepID=A0A0M3JAB2_ANISI|nr:unnamed protein product [Anisakis simplex]